MEFRFADGTGWASATSRTMIGSATRLTDALFFAHEGGCAGFAAEGRAGTRALRDHQSARVG
jgi:hypothetical protein